MEKKWLGSKPKECDICSNKIGKVFVDGRTNQGPWAIMCINCHKIHGCGLGMGFGQMYKSKGKDYIKVGG